MVEEDHVPRLLAAEVEAARAHGLDDVAVADLGANQLALLSLDRALEAEVAHHRRDQRLLAQAALANHPRRAERHHRVAVDLVALLVDHDHPIGVAIEGDAEVGLMATDLARRHRGVQRAGVLVDVLAVRLDAQREHLGAELREDRRRDAVGSAVGGVDHDAHAVEGEVLREGRLDEGDVAAGRVVEAKRGPIRVFGRPLAIHGVAGDQLFELDLHLIGQLEAVRPEDLDAVVLIGVVRGADHHAGVRAHARREVGDGRRRERPREHDLAAHGADARRERGLEHVARQARVLADDDPRRARASLARLPGDGCTDAEGDLRSHHPGVGETADAVGPEEGSRLLGHARR